jgi:hypothetical protein
MDVGWQAPCQAGFKKVRNDSNERDRSRDRKRDGSRDRVCDRDRSRRSSSYEPERGDEGRDDTSVLAWIPSTSIDYDVIYEGISLYMGAGSTVERRNHPKVT